MESTEWIVKRIKEISLKHRNRTAGEASVKACMDEMAEELGLWSDAVIKDEFEFHPRAFIGSIALMSFLDVCAVACLWAARIFGLRIYYYVSPALFLISLCLIVFEFALYRRPFDLLYPKRRSFNVFSVIKAGNGSRGKLIFCAHADAAYEMRMLAGLEARQFAALAAMGIIGMISFLVFGIINAFGAMGPGLTETLLAVETAFIPVFVPWFFFADWDVVADGANDDLTGCCIAMSIMKELHDKGVRPDHTDVCCLITDGEESGLRGAWAFAEKHKRELEKSMVIAVDTIHDAGELSIYHRGINFTRRNSPEVCGLIRRAGRECGADIPKTGFYPGANDADAFSRVGVRAAGLCAVPHRPPEYYHTRRDTWENIEPDCIELTRKVLMKAIELADGEDNIF